MTVLASLELPQSPEYLIKHTFINVAEEEDEDSELMSGTRSRGRSNTWDGSTCLTASTCSLECNADGDDTCDTSSQPSTSAASCAQESNLEASTDGGCWMLHSGWYIKVAPWFADEARMVSNNPLNAPSAPEVASATSSVVADLSAAGRKVKFIQKNDRTTITLRNLPNDYMRDTVAYMLDSHGFAGKYNFIYVPVDFKRWAGFGYAFVNMISNRDAQRMHTKFQGFNAWNNASVKVCDVSWESTLQGLESHIERYRNSPVMHCLVPEEFKPAMYQEGHRAEFPAPTKRLRPPREKCSRSRRVQNFSAPSVKSVA